jgi:hypothetical protein
MSRPALRHNNPPIKGAPGTTCSRLKWPEREYGNSPQPNSELRMSADIYLSTLYAFMVCRGAVLPIFFDFNLMFFKHRVCWELNKTTKLNSANGLFSYCRPSTTNSFTICCVISVAHFPSISYVPHKIEY